MQLSSKNQSIIVRSKIQYTCFQQIVCCKCFSCLQQQQTITSDIRKQTLQRMIEDYKLEDDEKIIMDPVKLMILIYVCKDDNVPSKHVQRCKINPSTGVINYRTDLQFYIPQICNYLVFHRNLQQSYLLDAMQRMCKLNFYFAHLYYFYMKSIQKNVTKQQIQILKPVVNYNIQLLQKMSVHFKKIKIVANDLFATSIDTIEQQNIDFGQTKQLHHDSYINQVVKDYQTKKFQYGKLTKIKIQDVILNKYNSIFQGIGSKSLSFNSTISFFQDLFYMCADLSNHQKKKQKAIQYIKMINQHLPAAVYIPFSKNSYRLCNVLKIITSQTKVFSTKQRAPVCICVELYCPSQALSSKDQSNFWINVQTPITLKMLNFKERNQYFARHYEQTAQFRKQRLTSTIRASSLPKNIMEQQKQQDQTFFCQMSFRQNKNMKQIIQKTKGQQIQMKNTFKQPFSVSLQTQVNSIQKQQMQNISEVESEQSKQKSFIKIRQYNTNTKKYYQKGFDKMFGQSTKNRKAKLAQGSIFGNFRSWDVIWIIIKTHDDLKQQQFAMQLIQQFSYIFKLQKLPLLLTTYEVLSMGPDRGIIQMVKDSVTFDTLKRTLKKQFPSAISLKDFFQIYFSDNIVEAKQTFLKSLVAYCLVTYIIQVKDRHNGNILLHRSGRIFHIDFGFFLSNMPGKGIQLQKDCPFKFLSEYIQVLDGVDSHYFKKFRQYFFLGFKAIKKHQNKILMLVKMMYTASGATMPCFSKGQITIKNLQERINPPFISTDASLNQHCQLIINTSLDNWASKWYDRFQYWAQGIFY